MTYFKSMMSSRALLAYEAPIIWAPHSATNRLENSIVTSFGVGSFITEKPTIREMSVIRAAT